MTYDMSAIMKAAHAAAKADQEWDTSDRAKNGLPPLPYKTYLSCAMKNEFYAAKLLRGVTIYSRAVPMNTVGTND